MFDRVITIDDDAMERVNRLGTKFGSLGTDAYGVDKLDVARFMTVLGWFYHHYFRAEVFGKENVPDSNRFMLIGNHSGGVALDAGMVMAAMFYELDPPRLVHGMIERFIHQFPGASQLMSRLGHFTGNPEQALKLLQDDRSLLIFPEGARGTMKLARDADTLVNFGTGFMRLALQTRSPIVPFAFVGGGEAIPTVANLKSLGKLLGVPYLPVTPYLLPLPKPTSFQLLIGEPMEFEGTGDEDDVVIVEKVEAVKDRIAFLIEQGRAVREHRLAIEDLSFR
ncbi:MAG: lysophospholipid acyltransferase family protein [Polyangiales bacterium]